MDLINYGGGKQMIVYNDLITNREINYGDWFNDRWWNKLVLKSEITIQEIH